MEKGECQDTTEKGHNEKCYDIMENAMTMSNA